MDSNKNSLHPRFYRVHNAWMEECTKLGEHPDSINWQKFIKKCGLQHISMSRLEAVDQKKWFLSKIKYGL